MWSPIRSLIGQIDNHRFCQIEDGSTGPEHQKHLMVSETQIPNDKFLLQKEMLVICDRTQRDCVPLQSPLFRCLCQSVSNRSWNRCACETTAGGRKRLFQISFQTDCWNRSVKMCSMIVNSLKWCSIILSFPNLSQIHPNLSRSLRISWTRCTSSPISANLFKYPQFSANISSISQICNIPRTLAHNSLRMCPDLFTLEPPIFRIR